MTNAPLEAFGLLSQREGECVTCTAAECHFLRVLKYESRKCCATQWIQFCSLNFHLLQFSSPKLEIPKAAHHIKMDIETGERQEHPKQQCAFRHGDVSFFAPSFTYID